MASLQLQSPYPQSFGPHRLRGNLHTHSTRSDGRLRAQDVIDRYARLGYDFLMLSDHDVVSDYAGLDGRGMLLIPGNEISAGGPHLLHVGAAGPPPTGDRQAIVDAIARDGGLAFLCHPNWGSDYDEWPIDMMRSMTGYVGLEVFNGGVHDGPGSPFALVKWDRLLSADRRVWGMANDDMHEARHVGRGWNVAVTGERSVAGVVDALRRGAFYASTGVTIESIACEGPTVTLVAPDAEAIAVMGRDSQRVAMVEGDRITFDASNETTPYIRLDCFGRGDRRAWTQPLWLRSEQMDRLRDLLADKPALPLLRSDRAPQMTGRGEDPLWQQAPVTDAFYLLPNADAPPVATQVRAVEAGGWLYLLIRCQEPRLADLKVGDSSQPVSSIWSNDSIELFINPQGRGPDYWQIIANAAGRLVMVAPDRSQSTGGGRAVAGRDDGGWLLELALDLGRLGGETDPGSEWGLNICRNRWVTGNAQYLVWSWVGRGYHHPEYFGLMQW